MAREHDLNEKDSENCWGVIKENLVDFGLIEESAGKQIVVPRAELESGKVPDVPQDSGHKDSADEDVQKGSGTKEKERQKPRDKKLPGYTAPQIAFNIQVVLPDNADPETYDAIFGSIAKHLL